MVDGSGASTTTERSEEVESNEENIKEKKTRQNELETTANKVQTPVVPDEQWHDSETRTFQKRDRGAISNSTNKSAVKLPGNKFQILSGQTDNEQRIVKTVQISQKKKKQVKSGAVD